MTSTGPDFLIIEQKVGLVDFQLLPFPSMKFIVLLKAHLRASLVAQWLRVCLPVQGTWVRALVWEDPTCRGAAGPVSHNY